MPSQELGARLGACQQRMTLSSTDYTTVRHIGVTLEAFVRVRLALVGLVVVVRYGSAVLKNELTV